MTQETNEEAKTCQMTELLVNGIKEMVKQQNSRVKEIILQDLLQDTQPDMQRLEIEEIARVIVTPFTVEIYTFDDHLYTVEFAGTKVNKLKLVGSFK